MLIGAGTFLSQVDLLRTVAVTGAKGSGKDLLCKELAEYYLKRGYKYHTNQRSIWNDDLFKIKRLTDEDMEVERAKYTYDDEGNFYEFRTVDNSWFRDVMGFVDMPDQVKKVKLKEREIKDVFAKFGRDKDGFFERVPDTNHMVLDLSEIGRYWRKWTQFEDAYEFTRKTDNYIFMPSIRLPHVDLCEMIVVNVFNLKDIVGLPWGVWHWSVSGNGLMNSVGGNFIFIPERMGIYDTHDLSTSPTEAVEWFQRNIAAIQRSQGRDGLQAMESGSSENDTDGLDTIARQISHASVSLSNKGKRR